MAPSQLRLPPPTLLPGETTLQVPGLSLSSDMPPSLQMGCAQADSLHPHGSLFLCLLPACSHKHDPDQVGDAPYD